MEDQLVVGERYTITWRDDLDNPLVVVFKRYERGFYVFEDIEGRRVVARPTSIILERSA